MVPCTAVGITSIMRSTARFAVTEGARPEATVVARACFVRTDEVIGSSELMSSTRRFWVHRFPRRSRTLRRRRLGLLCGKTFGANEIDAGRPVLLSVADCGGAV